MEFQASEVLDNRMLEMVLAVFMVLVLVTTLVIALHRHQRLSMQENASRHLPLPPLRKTRLPTPAASGPRTLPTPPKLEPVTPRTGSSPNPAAATTGDDAPSWYEQLAHLKRDNRLQEALALCQGEFPLWSAFQQAVLIKRAQVKALQQAGREIGTELEELYRLAAIAGFLHDHLKDSPALSLSRLKLLSLKQIFDLEMPYQQIGYLQLRLIKKTDIKWLVEHWGKPGNHQSPRQFHREFWQAVVAPQTGMQ